MVAVCPINTNLERCCNMISHSLQMCCLGRSFLLKHMTQVSTQVLGFVQFRKLLKCSKWQAHSPVRLVYAVSTASGMDGTGVISTERRRGWDIGKRQLSKPQYMAQVHPKVSRFSCLSSPSLSGLPMSPYLPAKTVSC